MNLLSDPVVGNVIQIVLIVLTVLGLWVALLNGKKGRENAIRLAISDRRAAEERTESDRREATVTLEDERWYLREQTQLQMQLDHALKLVQTAENYPVHDVHAMKHWGLSMRASIIVLGQDAAPAAWSVFIDRARSWDEGREDVLREINDLAIQAARTLNCSSCVHVHRMPSTGRA
ncbi:hypothetical protein GCM10027404_33240 [Arthrobacter tumbae]|uniref:hypothetical protein n=1 Tax=Arthrobacter tumbae TaxID=163874 RepID=UPI0019590977|nr:hypothetical protein [Arthrobacter tumbae]MBM7781802.1 hypothetical protein [Arthrobacter tumbae]